jgi:hypothetical protein
MGKSEDSIMCCFLKEIQFTSKSTHTLRLNNCKISFNTIRNKSKMELLSDKMTLSPKTLRDKENQYILAKISMEKEVRMTVNIYAPNTGLQKYIYQAL